MAGVRREPKAFPLPEALPEAKQPASGVWTVRPSSMLGGLGGRVNPAAGVMEVPLEADDEHAACVRAHEMGHARWSPANAGAAIGSADAEIIQMVEDARVHRLLIGKAKVDLSAGLVPLEVREAWAKRLVKPDGEVDVRGVTLAALATRETGDAMGDVAMDRAESIEGEAARERAKALVSDARSLAGQAFSRINAKPGKFQTTKDVAEWLASMLATREEARKRAEQAAREEREGAGRGRKPGKPSEKGPPVAESENVFKDTRFDPKGRTPATGVARGGKWGEMTIERPARPLALPRRVRAALKGRPSDEGTRVKHWSRWITDRRVFDAPKAMRAGTVVIDLSGSMCLTPAQVLAMVEAAPAATIAGYEGDNVRGVLRIFAERGRRVPDALVRGPLGVGGNTVDGPALRWLAKQRGPRLWVSDGGVCGAQGDTSAVLYREVAEICRASGIVRVPSPGMVPEVMRARVR